MRILFSRILPEPSQPTQVDGQTGGLSPAPHEQETPNPEPAWPAARNCLTCPSWQATGHCWWVGICKRDGRRVWWRDTCGTAWGARRTAAGGAA